MLLVSCYELGHQPLAVASAAAFLERAGYTPALVDLSVEHPDLEILRRARLVAISVPMHTALRVGVRFARQIRRDFPAVHVCFFGLYATLNAEYLLRELADSIIGGEFEDPLVGLADALAAGAPPEDVPGVGFQDRPVPPHLRRLSFPVPTRKALPPLDRYARLEVEGETRLAAAVEASRGCLHHCRHCPIPPVYGGRFFVVPRAIVLEDVRRLAASGAAHITFVDADFLNGPGHSLAIVRAMHEEFPRLTFDLTTKVEHILKNRRILPELAALGCLFVVSAVESLSDEVLAHLDKGHTRKDVFAALTLMRAAGITLRPSLLAFTPWTRLGDYEDLLDWVEGEDLVSHVDPVQFSIRLLVPPGSLLASLPAMKRHLGALGPDSFSHTWSHPDPRMDELHRTVSTLVHEAALRDDDPELTFQRIRAATAAAGERATPPRVVGIPPGRLRTRPPRLTEPWFC